MNQSAGRSTQKTKDTTPTTTTIPTTGKWKMSPEHILRKLKTHTYNDVEYDRDTNIWKTTETNRKAYIESTRNIHNECQKTITFMNNLKIKRQHIKANLSIPLDRITHTLELFAEQQEDVEDANARLVTATYAVNAAKFKKQNKI